jgi:hypothetical protein
MLHAIHRKIMGGSNWAYGRNQDEDGDKEHEGKRETALKHFHDLSCFI